MALCGRRSGGQIAGIVVSVAIHGGVLEALSTTDATPRRSIPIQVRTVPRPRKVAPPERVEPVRPAEATPSPEAKRPEPKRADPRPARPSGPADPPASPSVAPPARAPSLGLVLGNDPGGSGAPIATPRPAEAAEPAKPVVPAPQKRAAEPRVEEACAEAPTKPVPTDKPEIEYPIEAREAGLEGRLVLAVHVAPDGSVERVEIVSGVGEALDRAAIRIVERWRFEPARRCGQAVGAVYTLARRFELGD